MDDDSEALDNLNEFVSNLDSDVLKRKATEDFSEVGAITDTRACKRRRLAIKERTEAGEFRARSSGIYFFNKRIRELPKHPKISGSKLNLDDLLSPLASQSSAALQYLKTSAKVLETSSSSKKAKTLSAPLPQRTLERLDRQAAYEKTKEEVDKWSETMKHVRMVSCPRVFFFTFSFFSLIFSTPFLHKFRQNI